jgi:hypothetical protein
VTSLLGVTVTNASAFVGLNAPLDATVRQLCLNALGAMSVRGVRSAYQYAVQTAVNATTGFPVNINRWTVSESSHNGTVTVYVASPSGAPLTSDVTGVQNNVEATARPSGISAIITAASTLNDTDALTVYCVAPAGTSSSALQTAVATGLATFYSNYPIGGLTASDNGGVATGLFAAAKIGNIGASLAAAGASLVSVAGVNDYALAINTVIVDATSVSVRILSLTNGTSVI